MLRRLTALTLAALLAPLAFAQVTTDYTKTGIPNGTPTAISATTGTGSTMVLQSSPTINTPTFVAPALGTPTSGVATNLTGTAASLSVGTATAVVSQTGTGTTYVANSSPTINTPTLSIPKLSTQTWASLPAAASNTWAVTVASNLGANGALVTSNGTRWAPVGGSVTLKSLGNQVTGVANSETIVLQALIPAGAWQTNDTVRIWYTMTKSGSTNTGGVTVRVGTAGTTSDTAVMALPAQMSAAQLNGGEIQDLKLISATTVQRIGGISAGNAGSFLGMFSGVAMPAAVTISDASANALFVTVTIQSSGVTDTVGMQSGQIQLITP